MIVGTSRAVRVFAYPAPVDLRKGYDGLFGLIQQGLRRDPLGGDLFLFVNKRRGECKVLVWDGTGLCISPGSNAPRKDREHSGPTEQPTLPHVEQLFELDAEDMTLPELQRRSPSDEGSVRNE
jgi:IS66 Orf2 like protein